MRSSSLTHLFVLFIVFLNFAASVSAQYQERALERARSVKMLSDDREAVRKIFYDFNLDRSDETSDDFSFGETNVEVTYSSGGCSEESSEEIWDVAAGRVVGIRIEEDMTEKPSDLRIDLRSLTREKMFANDDEQFMFHSKAEGIAVRVNGDKVRSIDIFPSVKSKAKVCKNDFAQDFVKEKSWFGKTKLKDRNIISCYRADVSDLTLSHQEISAVTAKEIAVATSVSNPNDDILTYGYTVTGGRIIGSGANVKWDLTGVQSGSYTITAAIDDGCGYCGATMTKTVVVK